jgi:hypothetical protein
MPKIEVISKISPYTWDARVVYVGRPSPLGNPFTAKEEGSREAAINKFETWFLKALDRPQSPQMQSMKFLLGCLLSGEDIALQCWCAPLPCHADIIKRELEKRYQIMTRFLNLEGVSRP